MYFECDTSVWLNIVPFMRAFTRRRALNDPADRDALPPMPMPIFKPYDSKDVSAASLAQSQASAEDVAAGRALPRDLHLALVQAALMAQVRPACVSS